jgi:Arc/MetJ-type ribon-helix-helix transcriptional regulator
MAKSIAVKPKKRGRPATGRDPFVGIRLPEELIASIEKWSTDNGVGSRSEAIRRLVELGIASAQPVPVKPPSSKTVAKATALAGEQIDRLHDDTATPKQRASRKRRLLKGPEEFREMRAPKRKR